MDIFTIKRLESSDFEIHFNSSPLPIIHVVLLIPIIKFYILYRRIYLFDISCFIKQSVKAKQFETIHYILSIADLSRITATYLFFSSNKPSPTEIEQTEYRYAYILQYAKSASLMTPVRPSKNTQALINTTGSSM